MTTFSIFMCGGLPHEEGSDIQIHACLSPISYEDDSPVVGFEVTLNEHPTREEDEEGGQEKKHEDCQLVEATDHYDFNLSNKQDQQLQSLDRHLRSHFDIKEEEDEVSIWKGDLRNNSKFHEENRGIQVPKGSFRGITDDGSGIMDNHSIKSTRITKVEPKRIFTNPDKSKAQLRLAMIRRDQEFAKKRQAALAEARSRSKPTYRLPGSPRIVALNRDFPNAPHRVPVQVMKYNDDKSVASTSDISAELHNKMKKVTEKKESLHSFLERNMEIARKRKEAISKARVVKKRDLFRRKKDAWNDDSSSVSSLSSSRPSSSSRLTRLYEQGKTAIRSDLQRFMKDKGTTIDRSLHHYHDDSSSIASTVTARSTSTRLEQLYQKGKQARRSDLEREKSHRDRSVSDEISLGSRSTSIKSTSLRLEQLYQKGKEARRTDLEKSIQRIRELESSTEKLNCMPRMSTPLRLEQLYEKGKYERRTDLVKSKQKSQPSPKELFRERDIFGVSRETKFYDLYKLLERDQAALMLQQKKNTRENVSYHDDCKEDDSVSNVSAASTLSCAYRRLNKLNKMYKQGKQKQLNGLRRNNQRHVAVKRKNEFETKMRDLPNISRFHAVSDGVSISSSRSPHEEEKLAESLSDSSGISFGSNNENSFESDDHQDNRNNMHLHHVYMV